MGSTTSANTQKKTETTPVELKNVTEPTTRVEQKIDPLTGKPQIGGSRKKKIKFKRMKNKTNKKHKKSPK